MSWQAMYARVTNPFGAKGPFYDALGHRGADYARAAHDPVYVYAPGVVEYVGHSGGLGTVVGIKVDDAHFIAFAHLVNVTVKYGDRVNPGDIIGYAAGHGDDHGSLWDGPHCHTTLSPASSLAAALGLRPLSDPAPYIAGWIGSTASSDGEALTSPDLPKGTLMPDISIILNTAAGQPTPPTQQIAVGPFGQVVLDGQTSTLLHRWLQFLSRGADSAGDAGGMTREEADLLRAKVLIPCLTQPAPASKPGATAEEIAAAVDSTLQDDFDAIPTAAENAAATRTAIIK